MKQIVSVKQVDMKSKVICWWSGGVTSAVACKLAMDLYGKSNCRVIMFDTRNEDDDTYRFKEDCEKWYGKEIEMLSNFNDKWQTIEDVWFRYLSLNVAKGAVCSSTLKRDVRLKFEKENRYKYQVFGFDFDKKEFNRAYSMKLNYPNAKPIFPLLMFGYSKEDCIRILEKENIEIPNAYKMGFNNNNCLKTMCIQGGIGYWQKVQRDFPEKFEKMAEIEHRLTDLKGEPVTMMRDQAGDGGLLFLKPHPKYPHIKDISQKKGREPKPLNDCNGFGCAINDLNSRNETEKEINYQTSLFEEL